MFYSCIRSLAALACLAICSSSIAGGTSPARIRLINEVASSDLKSAFASWHDPVTNLWSDFTSIKCTVPWAHPGKYNKKFAPGHYEVHIIGGNNTVFHTSTMLDLVAGHDYTFFATGIGNNVESFYIDQPTIAKKSGLQTLQFVNCSPDSGPVDFYTNGTIAASGIAYKSAGAAFDVITIPTYIEIKYAGTNTPIDAGWIKIAKESRTIFTLTGTKDSNDSYPLWGFYYTDKSKSPGEYFDFQMPEFPF
jgi:hypothetical protein